MASRQERRKAQRDAAKRAPARAGAAGAAGANQGAAGAAAALANLHVNVNPPARRLDHATEGPLCAASRARPPDGDTEGCRG
jgi:hypothetical protein